MALDQFRTQVLLLHSEQSTLDILSSGFNDRYTVHCATSGSEALTTLGDTPINVIVSAQDLPGMSGVEALREAKKRSPETIGILLAGNSDRDLEALVGDKEVFQVVRGNITRESILKLVDNATQQVRLMALAESANDTAANVDEPAEHIIMETSENGSTIISDGTGRMPALSPEKVAAATATGARAIDVLVLTKDQEFLATIKESSHGMHRIHYANTLKQADESIRKHKVGVAVVDAAMVGDKVEQLTQHLRQGSPRLVPIVAGRRDDGEMLMDLINRGKVYRFLLKPVSPGRARLAVEASVKHHLEAPDAAFKTKGMPPMTTAPRAAPNPTPRPTAKPAPQPAAKPAPKTAPRPVPAASTGPAPKPRAAPAKPKKAPPAPNPVPVDPPFGNPTSDSPVNDGLSAAFGGDDSSFAETMTGIISGVGNKLRGNKDEAAAAPSGAGGSVPGNRRVIGISAAALAVIAVGVFWFMSGNDLTVDGAPPVEQNVAVATPSITEADVVFDEEPAAEPVFDVDEALSMAETALLEARLDDAGTALQRVAQVDADNSRLVFLSTQLRQMQLRGYLNDARAAIRDTRFEDAGNLLAAALALNVADTSEIEAVTDELSTARSQQQVDEVLALATARLEEGSLLSPANDNARYYYGLVLSNDPGNTAARQGLNVVASRLVLQARAEIDAGNLDAADGLLADTRAIDPSNAELAATATALIDARDEIAAQERRAEEARRRAEADRRAAAQRAEAERAAAEEAQVEADAPQAVAEEPQAEADAPQAAAEEAVVDEPVEEAQVGAQPIAQASVDEKPVAADSVDEPPADVRNQSPVGVSSLQRVKYVAPKYPRAAQRRNQSGWVDVAFTVALDGTVKDVEVRESRPAGAFDNAATRAVEKWEFEPVVENGVTIERRAAVRMMFALE